MRSSLKPNIHIIDNDRVLYCRMAFLSPIIEDWLWKWYRGIGKYFSSSFCFCFSGIFHSFCAFVLRHIWIAWKYLCGNHDYAKSKKQADFVLKKVKRPKKNFDALAPCLRNLSPVVGDPSVWIPLKTDRQTNAGNNNTRRPKLALDKMWL